MESFAIISALKIKSFRNLPQYSKFRKHFNLKILTKMKISASTVYVISQIIILGGRETTQEGCKILPKVSPKLLAKFWEYFVSSKFKQNRNTSIDS